MAVPHKLNPLGLDRDYPVMNFSKDGNLFNINATLNSFLYSNGDGTYTVIWLTGGRSGNFFDVDIKAGEPYTVSVDLISTTSTGLSMSVQLEYTDGTFGAADISGTGQKYINRTEIKDIKRIRVLFVNFNTVQGQSTIFKDFMIKKGTATSYPTYEPYNPYTYSVEGQSMQTGTPTPVNPIPILSNYPKGVYKTNWGYIRLYEDLRGIGEYRDKIVYDTSTREYMLTHKVGEKVLNGNETWDLATVTTDNSCISFYFVYLNPAIFRAVINALSEQFKGVSRDLAGTVSGECFGQTETGFFLAIYKHRLNTENSSGLKTWLIANNFKYQYILATPTNEPL